VAQQVADILAGDEALQRVLDKHLAAAERRVSLKANAVLDQLADEVTVGS
jgi:hypothetical protein